MTGQTSREGHQQTEIHRGRRGKVKRVKLEQHQKPRQAVAKSADRFAESCGQPRTCREKVMPSVISRPARKRHKESAARRQHEENFAMPASATKSPSAVSSREGAGEVGTED